MRRLLILLTALLLIATVGVGASILESLLRRGPDCELLVVVPEGCATKAVLDILHTNGLLPSPLAARVYLAIRARGRSFRYGHYRIAPSSRPIDVLEQILAGAVDMVSVRITEGSGFDEIAEVFTGAGVGDKNDWSNLLRRTEWIGDVAPTAPTLEGFLFPDTYSFEVGISAEAAARHLVEQWKRVWNQELGKRGFTATWGSALEVVTMASLVEAETSVPEERPRVAGVFLNRLRRGMLLQCDPTVVFVLKRRGEWQGRLLRVHWQIDDPYNTYRYPGLPPGPINSPGRAALVAALDPEDHDFLYFVAKPGGGHRFSRTLKEHNRAVTQLFRSRR